jgi:uncharacterized metal-binding protein YceD (DUF177 family)
MIFKGRVAIQEVDQNPVEIRGDQKDGWVQTWLARAAPQGEMLNGLTPEAWAEKSTMKVDVRLDKVGNDYGVKGSFRGLVPSICSRCGDPFLAARSSEFSLYLHRNTGEEDHPDGPAEDPDYIFFSGDQIDLIDLLSEQLIVLEPIAEGPTAESPKPHCKCWEEPEFQIQSPGQAPEKKAVSPFAKLQDLFKKED